MSFIIAIRWDRGLFALTDAGDPQEFADLDDSETKPVIFPTREQAEKQLLDMDTTAQIIEVNK